MDPQLLSPPNMAPPHPATLTAQQYIAEWMDLVDASEQLLLAGLKRDLDAETDLNTAHRRWYQEKMHEHDRTVFRMLEELHHREGQHGR